MIKDLWVHSWRGGKGKGRIMKGGGREGKERKRKRKRGRGRGRQGKGRKGKMFFPIKSPRAAQSSKVTTEGYY